MPTIEIVIEVLETGTQDDPGEVFSVVGFPRRAASSVFVEDSVVFDRTEIDISGLGGPTEPPDPVISAQALGAPPSATEATVVDTLSAQLIDDDTPPNVVELYDPAKWNWSIDSGGGSFGGPNGDELTMPAAPATVVIRATHIESNLQTTATIESVATSPVQTELEIYGVPVNVVQGESYEVLVRERDSATDEIIQDPATGVGLTVVSGPGSISAGNTLNVNPGSAGGTIQLTATKTGVQSASVTLNVIVQPTFPEVLQSVGLTEIESQDGSTQDWGAGWNPNPGWNNPDRFSIVSDPGSKFGSAIEKRGFVGDSSGWRGGLNNANNIANGFREIYVRFVFAPSSNWEPHPGTGDKLFYWGRKIGTGSPTQYYLQIRPDRQVFFIVQNIYANQPWVSAQARPQGVGRVNLGTYNTVEFRHRLNTPGNADGSFVYALNGDIATDFISPVDDTDPTLSAIEWVNPNVVVNGSNWDVLEWGGGQFFRFWGGQGATATRADNWRMSELYIAGRN